MKDFLGLPEAASAHAGAVDQMMGLLHWLILILFLGWGIYFIYVLYRFRARKNPKADYVGTRSRASSYVEGAVVLAEAVLLIGFAIPLWAERVDETPPPQEAVVVRVIAEQFAWNVHYPGPDGVFGKASVDLVDTELNPLGIDSSDPYAKDDIVTLNQLHLPVGKPALIYLASKDVIHSFSLPEMRIKQDAIPGLQVPVWFTPTVTTEQMRQKKGKPDFNYEIACAQLCGIGHYRMKGFMTIHEADDFTTWLSEQEGFGDREIF